MDIPIKNLFFETTTPQLEPQLTKRLILDQPNTPQFGLFPKSPLTLKQGTPLKVRLAEIQQPTPSTTEHDQVKQKLASKIIQNFNNQTPSPRTPTKNSNQSLKEFTGQKNSSTPKRIKLSNETPHKKSVQKTLFTQQWNIEEEIPQKSVSRYYNEFTQLNVIGSGNFGTVYQCRNNFDNQVYAIKCTKINKYKKYTDADEAINEAQALAYMTAKGECQNIIRYYTAWKEGSHQYLLMEYCDYNVSTLLRQKQMDQEIFQEWELKLILKHSAKGLKHLHSQSITHLDVKPDNILYNKKEGNYKIADLGLSRQSQLKKGEDINEGDSRYMAPEILNYIDQQQDLSKSDIFSLGASLLELILGRELPKNGEEWIRIRQGLTIYDFGQNGSIYSIKLRQLICQMMNPIGRLRISAKDILESDYMRIKKENYIQWERIRSVLLRRQLDDIKNKQQLRQHSV